MPRPTPSRRLFHIATGLTLALLVFFLGEAGGVVLIASLFLLTVLVEGLRLWIPAMNRVFVSLLGPMLKDMEVKRPTGVGYFLAGVLVCLLFFDLEVALASIVILSVGDPAAAAVGQRWGRIRMGEKSLEGAIAFFVVALLTGVFLQDFWPNVSFGLFATGAFIGALVECLPLKIDDNLILPFAAGLAMETTGRFFLS
jgi:dolichol kinase